MLRGRVRLILMILVTRSSGWSDSWGCVWRELKDSRRLKYRAKSRMTRRWSWELGGLESRETKICCWWRILSEVGRCWKITLRSCSLTWRWLWWRTVSCCDGAWRIITVVARTHFWWGCWWRRRWWRLHHRHQGGQRLLGAELLLHLLQDVRLRQGLLVHQLSLSVSFNGIEAAALNDRPELSHIEVFPSQPELEVGIGDLRDEGVRIKSLIGGTVSWSARPCQGDRVSHSRREARLQFEQNLLWKNSVK